MTPGERPSRDRPRASGRVGTGAIVALAVLLAFAAVVLVVIPRKSRSAADRRGLMERFMEQDYVCCDLSVARTNPRCGETLEGVRALSHDGPNSPFTVPAGNALARCAASELIDFAGDAAVLKQPEQFLLAKIRSGDVASARRAARLLLSDPAMARETAAQIGSGSSELVAALAELLVDEQEPGEVRAKAGAMLAELGDASSAAVPALTQALGSRSSAVRRSVAETLAGMGLNAIAALPALTRQAYREPVPGLRDDLLAAVGTIDPVAGCCNALFRDPDPMCDESLTAIARHERQRNAEEVCPAALVLEISGNLSAIAHPMPYFEQALRAPDIATRRRAAVSVAVIAGTLRWKGRVGRDAVEALHEAVRSGDPSLVLDAAEALRQIDDSSPEGGIAAEPAFFVATLEDAHSDRRAAAAWVLGQIVPPAAKAVPVLRLALDEPEEDLADSAYGALNRIAVASGLERLGIKRDGRYELRPEVMEALLALSQPGAAAVAR